MKSPKKNRDEEEGDAEEEDIEGKKRMHLMMLRMCAQIFYLENYICAEFRGNTAKTRSTVHDRQNHSMSVNRHHYVWLVTTNR